jgi:tetraacyldisaccharide 4'-kinase
MMGKWAASEGYRAAVLSRGYGGSYRDNVLEVSDGTTIHTDSVVSGDEPFVLARNLRGVPVVISHRRYLAGRYAQDKFGSDFFILDDGFQHVKLKRDLDLVLVDAGDPFGNGRLLPRGPLREPVDNLARAGAFIVTRYRGDASSEETVRLLKDRFPAIPVFFAEHVPKQVVFPGLGETYDVGFLRERRVVAFAAIAGPEHFHQTLVQLGAHVVHFEGFKDHHLFTQAEISRLDRKAVTGGAECILTTEKDWARLRAHADACVYTGYLQIEFQLLPGGEALLEAIRDVAEKRRAV